MTDVISAEDADVADPRPDRIVHFMEYLAAKKAQKPLRRFLAGWPRFDDKLDGVMVSEVTVVTGKTGEGKTLFAESWLLAIAGTASHMGRFDDVRFCIMSFEVEPELLLAKYEKFPTAPLYLPLELRTMDTEWLDERIHEAKMIHGCEVFLLDHLHFLVDMVTKQNMSLNIGAFVRQLKQIAKRHRVAIILIAHQKSTTDAEPSLENVRDSSFIAQEADNVLVVWRKKDPTAVEIHELGLTNRAMADALEGRIDPLKSVDEPFGNGFAMVQIAKARRKGTFRWSKLFQKVGDFVEEV